MTLEEIMGECPSLEHLLRTKSGQFARMIERGLVKMSDYVEDANRPEVKEGGQLLALRCSFVGSETTVERA